MNEEVRKVYVAIWGQDGADVSTVVRAIRWAACRAAVEEAFSRSQWGDSIDNMMREAEGNVRAACALGDAHAPR